MEDNSLPKELEQIVNKVRLKQPSDGFLNSYGKQVDDKINYALKTHSGFRFSIFLSGLVLVAVFAGLYYMYIAHNQRFATAPVLAQSKENILKEAAQLPAATEKEINIEDELDTLILLEPEFIDELIDSIDSEDLLDEFSGFDEAEFAATSLQTSLTR